MRKCCSSFARKASYLICFVFLVLAFSCIQVSTLKRSIYTAQAETKIENLTLLGEEGTVSYKDACNALLSFDGLYKNNVVHVNTILSNYESAKEDLGDQDSLDKNAEKRYVQLNAERDYYSASQDLLNLKLEFNRNNIMAINGKLEAYRAKKKGIFDVYSASYYSNIIDDETCRYKYYDRQFDDHFLNKRVIPSPNVSYIYNKNKEAQKFRLDNFDSSKMTLRFEDEIDNITEGELQKTNAGSYTVVVALKDDYTWSDFSTDDIEIPFEIQKRALYDERNQFNNSNFPKLEDKVFPYDGKYHRLEYQKTEYMDNMGIEVEFSNNNDAKDPGVYDVTINFKPPDEENYFPIPSQSAKLIIQAGKVTDSNFGFSLDSPSKSLDPTSKLCVEEISIDDLSEAEKELTIFHMRPRENFGNIYDIKYIEPNKFSSESVNLIMTIPKSLRNKVFRVVHIHTLEPNLYNVEIYDALPKNQRDIVQNGKYFTCNEDQITLLGVGSFSAFCFLYENPSLSNWAILLIVLSAFVFAFLVAFLVLFILWKQGKSVGHMASIFARMSRKVQYASPSNKVAEPKLTTATYKVDVLPAKSVKKIKKVIKKKAINTKTEEERKAMKKAVKKAPAKKAPAKKVAKKAPAKKVATKKAVKKAPAKSKKR